MRILLATVLVTILGFLCTGSTLDIPQQGRVILSSGNWTPTAAQTESAYRCVQAFLEKPIVRDRWYLGEIAHIRTNKNKFRVQFIGENRDGQKVILCNFFPAHRSDDREAFEYWKRQKVEVMDGGFWFWQIEYDPETDRCSQFRSNGYA